MARKPFCPPTEAEAFDVTHSYSQDETMDRCDRLWAYKYLLGLREDDFAAGVYGNAVHDMLEAVYNGQSLQDAFAAGNQYLDEHNGDALIPTGRQWLVGHGQGYATHVYPGFAQQWRPILTEVQFEYDIVPGITSRGYIDLVAQRVSDNQIGIFDFKTTSAVYQQKLCENLSFSAQFADYVMAWIRDVCPRVFPGVAPFWPCYVGYHFLLKPKKGDDLSKEKMYKQSGIEVTPRFQQFAIECEANNVRRALRKRAMKQDYARTGREAFERIPGCYTRCFAFGEMCRFSDGCHSGQLFHRQALFEDRRP